MSLSVNFLLIFSCLFGARAHAQISVGLRESALGNSGAAITESSAPSYYNPALLAEKQKSYFSLTGTTLTSFKSKTEAGDFNSTKIAPNYLSSIHAFESYVHEFSLTNQLSVDSRIFTPVSNGSSTTDLRTDQYSLAYSFAFRDFPFGFQLGLRINEQNIHLGQNNNDGNIATGVDWTISQRVGNLYAGFGGLHQFGEHYRLGYKYESPGVRVYQKTDQTGHYYVYDKGANSFTSGKTQGSAESNNFNAQAFAIGHSFAWDNHEMLTDSRFTEDSRQKNKYTYFQTFGYKINFTNKMQFMCGLAHEFESRSNYFSAGYSWVTNTLRSTISAYHASQESEAQSTGLTFGSEFTY